MDLPEGALEEGEEGGGPPVPAEAGKGSRQAHAQAHPRPAARGSAPSGVRMQGPRLHQARGPRRRSVDLMKLASPRHRRAAPQMPLMPNQVVFRHKAWLPWWVAVLIPLLLLLALLLFLFLPRNVVVPDVTGAKSAFEAEKKLTKAAAQARAHPEGRRSPPPPRPAP